MKNSEVLIKIGLAILFFLCLLDMPYGFYQFVRFVSLIGFGILAYQANQEQKQTEMIIYGALALLFQPFFKIAHTSQKLQKSMSLPTLKDKLNEKSQWLTMYKK